jgi:hypothetical protein
MKRQRPTLRGGERLLLVESHARKVDVSLGDFAWRFACIFREFERKDVPRVLANDEEQDLTWLGLGEEPARRSRKEVLALLAESTVARDA